SLGFTRNRDAMRAVAERLPYDHLDARLVGRSREKRFERAAGLLLGLSGFLPLSPHERELAELTLDQSNSIENYWRALGTAWHGIVLPASSWKLARVRPAAHPLRRLLALAVLLSRLE